MRRVMLFVALLCLAALPLAAQDPVKVDAKHYKVESENAQVRVLRIHYGPHEKSVMHSHPAGVATFLTDSKFKFTMPDGKTEERGGKAGEVQWSNAETHLPENVGDKPADVILVELKSKTAAPAKMPPPPPKKKSTM
jgi:quercetin dioxygenase-like cupin family protein